MSEIAQSLPRYRCHKEVWALKIAAVTVDAGWQLVPENKQYLPIPVSDDWYEKNKPQAGGYWVQYKDGYTSYSPAEAFEEGYSLITPITQANTFARGAP